LPGATASGEYKAGAITPASDNPEL